MTALSAAHPSNVRRVGLWPSRAEPRAHAGYSARSGNDHAALAHELAELPRVVIDADGELRVLAAQAQLAVTGHHRLPLVDLIIAALADLHGLAVLHYDADYDVILQHTDLRYESRWLAPRGSL